MSIHESLQADAESGLAVLAFKVQAGQFDLNRELKYISMKDQIIRGRTLILGAYRAGLIGPSPVKDVNQSNVVIIGGGIGGISAALAACQLGLTVQVIEASDKCFPLLSQGTDRLFSATVYDWPHSHSGTHGFPFIKQLRDQPTIDKLTSSSVLRFPTTPVTAVELQGHLLYQLATFETKYAGALNIRYGHRLKNLVDVYLNPTSRLVVTEVWEGTTLKHLKSQIVVFALGFGLDKSNEQTAAAKDFFSYAGLKDDIAKAEAGARLVRIVGAGDGGLQEALRFIFSDDYQDFHKTISVLEDLLTSVGHGPEWVRICARLQSAEDHAAKSLMWGYTESVVFGELDALYGEMIAYLLKNCGAVVRKWRRQVARSTVLTVELVDRRAYSLRVYGLNRFLTMIVEHLPEPGKACLRRVELGNEANNPDVVLFRAGFAAEEKPEQIGTANEEDLLRRIAFRAIPMNLDAVV